MFKFTFHFVLLVIVLLFGVLLGMQQANDGLLKMKGYADPSLQGAFSINQAQNGDVEAAFLGRKVTSHDLKEKQEKLEEIKAFNFFSTIGEKLAYAIKLCFQFLLKAILFTFDIIVNSLMDMFK
jgi:hypothetical protein